MTIAIGNLAVLDQGLRLLDDLDDDLYQAPGADGGSSIGAHVRHCIDFFERFLAGLEDGRVDYDARGRDPRIAADRNVARSRFLAVRERLEQLTVDDASRTLTVRADAAAAAAETTWCPSSVGRELQVLLSHTVHHYALIALCLRAHGVVPPPGFGVAPSTLASGSFDVPATPLATPTESCAG